MAMTFRCWSSLLWIAACTESMPAEPRDEAARYLRAYGYLAAPADDPISDDELTGGLTRLQQRYGLSAGGALDLPTLALIRTPRCGVPDIEPGARAEVARFAVEAPWPTGDLTYSYVAPTTDLTLVEQETAIDQALARWAAVAPLTFTRVAVGGALAIGFYPAAHGGAPQGDTAFADAERAHAFYPGHPFLPGDVHLNDTLMWRVNGSAHDLPTVAIHELGHALGLRHSTVTSAVMYPGLPQFAVRRELAPDDIAGIQALYLRPPTDVFNASEHCLGMNNVHWTGQPGAIEYRLSRSLSPSFANPTLVGGYATSPAEIVVPQGQTWYLRVRSCSAYACSGDSNQVSATYYAGSCD